jgi:hypothetical protein
MLKVLITDDIKHQMDMYVCIQRVHHISFCPSLFTSEEGKTFLNEKNMREQEVEILPHIFSF